MGATGQRWHKRQRTSRAYGDVPRCQSPRSQRGIRARQRGVHRPADCLGVATKRARPRRRTTNTVATVVRPDLWRPRAHRPDGLMRLESNRGHAVLSSAVAVLLGLLLFIIFCLDHPAPKRASRRPPTNTRWRCSADCISARGPDPITLCSQGESRKSNTSPVPRATPYIPLDCDADWLCDQGLGIALSD